MRKCNARPARRTMGKEKDCGPRHGGGAIPPIGYIACWQENGGNGAVSISPNGRLRLRLSRDVAWRAVTRRLEFQGHVNDIPLGQYTRGSSQWIVVNGWD